jgi:hypothetical protein
MQKIRVLGATVALGGLVLLTGCAVAPGDPYYGGGYSQPYYTDPSPVIVSPPPVYINGGGYYEQRRPYYGRPYYDRPYYDRPGYPAVRPGYPVVRPGVPVAPVRPGWGGGGRPPGGGAVVPPTGNTGVSPLPQYRSAPPRGPSSLWTTPSGGNPPP